MKVNRRCWIRVCLGAAWALRALGDAETARAERVPNAAYARSDRTEDTEARPAADPARDSAGAGAFLPLTLPAGVVPARAFAMAFGGYDSAARNARLVSFAEARLYGPLALRFGAQSTAASERIAPSLAARLQVLSQATQGLDAAVSLAYNAEGFSELEGELELVVALGRTLGNWRLLANFAYGQAPEAKERDGELRTAALYHFGARYFLGLDARGRLALGSDAEEQQHREHEEPKLDADAGPVFDVTLGPFVLGAHAGLSALEFEDAEARFGAVALLGLGAAL